MKKIHIVLLILIVAGISGMSFFIKDLTTYETFESAADKKEQFVVVKVKLDQSKPIYYDQLKDPNYTEFYALDQDGNSRKVVYKNAKPTDIEKSEGIDPFSGTVYLTTLFWMQGSFILWYVIFRRPRVDLRSSVLIVVLLGLTIGRALFLGNRAGLLQVFLLVILAYFLSGRKLNFRRAVVAGSVLSLCIIAGMIYGTTFRNLKGGEGRYELWNQGHGGGKKLLGSFRMNVPGRHNALNAVAAIA